VHCVLAVVDVEMVGFSVEHKLALGDPVRYPPHQSSEVGSAVLFVHKCKTQLEVRGLVGSNNSSAKLLCTSQMTLS
jgi:hypothetical protein